MDRLTYKRPDSEFRSLSLSADRMSITEFPSYSISIYDDPNLIYKRQSISDKQILSNIVSDEFYETDESAFLNNYQNGETYETMTYYVKVVVDKNISEDTVLNTPSNVFFLSRTQIFFSVVTNNYVLYLKEKTDKYTIYTTSFSIPRTDFIKNFDGNVYLNLVGEFDVEYSLPINIEISNTPSTSLPQTTTTQVIKTLSSKASNTQYFKNYPTVFGRYFVSDSFDYNFEQISLTLNNNIFSTSTQIYQTNSSLGAMLRMDLNGESLLDSFDYYAFTFKNDDALFDPSNDATFSLKIHLDSGKTLSLDSWTVLENNISNYYNVVFDLSLLAEVGFVDYIIIEIRTTNDSIAGKYSITYANFATINTDTIRIQSLMKTFSASEPITHDVYGGALALEDLKNHSIINSIGGFSIVQNSIEFNSDLNYLIKTQESSIFLPDSSQILTKDGMKYVDGLTKKDLLYYKGDYETIQNISVKVNQNYNVFETYNNDEFDYLGFIVKLPAIAKNYKRNILPKNNITQTLDSITIDGKKYFFKSDGKTRFINDNIELQKENIHEIQCPRHVKIKVSHSQPITAEDIKVFAIDSGKSFCVLDRNIKGKIKSTANLSINKILVIDET